MLAQVQWAGWHQTLLWRPEGAPWRSEGLSEAEDWLGREASRPWEGPGRDLYSTYAEAKKRKPSTCRERGCWTRAAHPGPEHPSSSRGSQDPYSGKKTPFSAQQIPSMDINAVSEGRKMHLTKSRGTG